MQVRVVVEAFVRQLLQTEHSVGQVTIVQEPSGFEEEIQGVRVQTLPLVDYYLRRGILVEINAVGPVDAITERILAALHWYKANALAAGADRPEWAFGPASR